MFKFKFKIQTAQQDPPLGCRDEWQLVMCRGIPHWQPNEPSDSSALASCCLENAGRRRPPPAAAAAVQGQGLLRSDLQQQGRQAGAAPDYMLGSCTRARVAEVPAFSRGPDGKTQVR